MDILERLIRLANKLDEMRLFDEAAVVDEIVKEARGYRELLAPGLMGVQDPTKMAPGAGAGGLKELSGPGILQPGQESGTAARGRKPNQKVLRFQKQYNQLRKQLVQNKIMDIPTVKKEFPWLTPDGLAGPKTKAARPMFPEMRKMLQGDKPKQPAPQLAPKPAPQPVAQPVQQPVPASGPVGNKEALTALEQIFSEKKNNGEPLASGQRNFLAKELQRYIQQGRTPSDLARDLGL